MTDLIHRYPVEPADDVLHFLFEQEHPHLDTDDDTYMGLFDAWRVDYLRDCAEWHAEGGR